MLQFIKNTFLHPLQEFIHDSRAIGIILLLSTTISLALANMGGGSSYIHFWEFHFDNTTNHHTHFGILSLPNSPLVIINDFLMAFFFFLAGMEIKREILQGELASFKKSILPIVAAVGGMIIPAILYIQFNRNGIYVKGWAIPTATDIAFTLGVASLLGKRVPVALKIFITALAIIDDLGAIIVIALFYGGSIKLLYLLGCAIIAGTLLLLKRFQVKFGLIHFILGFILWYCMFNSGIHATVAGVVFALFIPVDKLSSFELKLHAPVYFLIMPIFALANTAIVFPENGLSVLSNTLSWGIIAGLVLGKPLGICGACYVLVKKKIAQLPNDTNWYQMIGASILAGIGFTMSIFIATLAFSSSILQDQAKVAVLCASLVASILGSLFLASNKP
jgi:NhaA family Na+:H+ antiporter